MNQTMLAICTLKKHFLTMVYILSQSLWRWWALSAMLIGRYRKLATVFTDANLINTNKMATIILTSAHFSTNVTFIEQVDEVSWHYMFIRDQINYNKELKHLKLIKIKKIEALSRANQLCQGISTLWILNREKIFVIQQQTASRNETKQNSLKMEPFGRRQRGRQQRSCSRRTMLIESK